LIKKAVFAMIESQVLSGNLYLEHAIFMDLFSGSGQMGLEAVSRGFKSAHLFEIDKSRVNFLIKNVSPLSEKLFIHNKDSFRFFDKTENIQGILTGIRGQYLIFDDKNVINIRRHTGYEIEINEIS
jgi:16S rRNA G966 N2-methylase RsmD